MILYFSGTGNSRHAAFELKRHLEDENIVDMGKMLKDNMTGDFCSEEPYVFVTPTYGWRIPRVINDLISRSNFSGNKKAYFVLTCGDSMGNAGKYAQKLCLEKGLDFAGCFELKMPENYLALFAVPDEKTSEVLIRRSDDTAKRIAAVIKSGEYPKDKKSLAGVIESSIVNSVFYKFIVKAKGFRVTGECIGCGFCSEVCPLNNVSIIDGRPVWGESCTHCMACICRCPKEAIEYKKASVGKRRYYLEK